MVEEAWPNPPTPTPHPPTPDPDPHPHPPPPPPPPTTPPPPPPPPDPHHPTTPVGLKVEAAMTFVEINTELVYRPRIPSFPPGTPDFDPEKHSLIEGASECVISKQEAQAKFIEYNETQGSHDKVYTDGSKTNERLGTAAVINRHFQNGETTDNLPPPVQKFPDNSTSLLLGLQP